MNPLLTSGIGRQAGALGPSSGCPARLPADNVSHPSMGHVLAWTAVTFSAAEEPSRSSLQRFGVRVGSMSAGLRPPVPMTTSRTVGLVCEGLLEAAPLVRSALLATTASTRRVAAAVAWSTCRRFTGLSVIGCPAGTPEPAGKPRVPPRCRIRARSGRWLRSRSWPRCRRGRLAGWDAAESCQQRGRPAPPQPPDPRWSPTRSGPAGQGARLVLIVSVTIVGLAVAGVLGARAAGTTLLRPTLRVVLGGSAAMIVTAAIGRIAHVSGL